MNILILKLIIEIILSASIFILYTVLFTQKKIIIRALVFNNTFFKITEIL